MTTDDVVADLSDGHPHAIPCPSVRHRGDPDAPLLYVRYVSPDRVWLLLCWSRPGCAYDEIARALNIGGESNRQVRGNVVAHMVAAYDHADPEERPRLVFHSWRDDPDVVPSPEERDRREAELRGTANGVHLMLWAPEHAEGPGHTLVVVGSEAAAMSLMRAGVYRHGYVPVTWYRAVRRLDEDRGSVSRVDWSRVHGRRVAFWPTQTVEAHAEMYRAAAMATAAGAAGLLMVDPRGAGMSEGEDAVSLSDRSTIMAVLGSMRVLPGYGADTETPTGTPDGELTLDGLLVPSEENATDVGMAIRVLRDHGHRIVLTSQPAEALPHDDVLWRADSGVLERRPGELGVALWRSRLRYLEELREARDTQDMPEEEFAACVRYAGRMASTTGLHAVADLLPTAYRILEERRYLPGGLASVGRADIDVDGRYLGAPNGIIDLDTGRLLSDTEARRTLVSCTIPDPYDPEAVDPDMDALTTHLGLKDRERLLGALGYALRGGTADRIYFIDGGMTSDILLNAVRTALGPRYSGTVPLGMLLLSDDRQEGNARRFELGRFSGPRILVGAARSGGTLDRSILGQLTLFDTIRARTIPDEGLGDVEPTATMFVGLSAESLADFGPGDRDLLTGLRLLRYPDGPAIDSAIGVRAGRSRTFRQALVALLVRHCVAMTGPPDHIPHPAPPHLTSRQRLATAADEWLLEAIDVTGNRQDRTSSSSLWEAARSDQGSGSDPDLAWGMSRRSLTTRAIEIHGLERTRSVRIGDAVVTGWMGVRLAAGNSASG